MTDTRTPEQDQGPEQLRRKVARLETTLEITLEDRNRLKASNDIMEEALTRSLAILTEAHRRVQLRHRPATVATGTIG